MKSALQQPVLAAIVPTDKRTGRRLLDLETATARIHSPALLYSLGIILNANVPMFLMWGRQHTFFCNDAFLETNTLENALDALGEPGEKALGKLWQLLQPLLSEASASGGALSFNKEGGFAFGSAPQKNGTSFSVSSVPDMSGAPGGILFTGIESNSRDSSARQDHRDELDFRRIADAIPGTIWITDKNGSCTYLNAHWYDMTGQTPETALGFGWLDAVHADDKETASGIFLHAIENHTPYRIYYRLRQKSGDYHWVMGEGNPHFYPDGGFSGHVGSVINIHEQKLAEDALKTSNERFHLINRATQDAIWDWNLLTNEVIWNEAIYKLFGYGPGQVKNDADWWYEHIHPADRKNVVDSIHEVIDAGGNSWTDEYRYQCADGSYKTVFDRGFILHDSNGKSIRMLGSMQDITRRKEVERSLKESEERFQAAVNAVQGIVWTNNAGGEMEGLQTGWAELTGQSYDEYQGYGWSSAVHPDDVAYTVETWNEAVRLSKPAIFEHRVRTKSGEYRMFAVRAIPTYDAEGAIREWVGVHTDITQQRQAEIALRESEERFRAMADNIPNLAWMADAEGWIFWYNKKWYDYTGTTEKEMEGWGWQSVHDPKQLPRVVEKWKRSIDRFEHFEMVFPLKGADGIFRPFLTRVLPVRDKTGRVVRWFGTNTDITAQVLVEEALRESSEKFRNLLEALPQITWTNFPDGEFNFFNQRWYDYTGLDFDQSRGSKWHAAAHPDDIHNTFGTLREALQTGTTFEVETRFRHRDGSYNWHLCRALPIRNEKGEIVLWVGTATDIQTQKEEEAQLEKLVRERTLELERSNQDLQQFAHVASHDLKEPLRKIQIFADRMESEINGSSEKVKNYLQKITHAASRMASMIAGVLNYSAVNAEEQAIRNVDLNEILEQIESDLEMLIHDTGAEIRYRNLPSVEGAPVLLYQLFYNLVNNSIKFRSKNEPPRIEISATEVHENPVHFAAVVLRDNGIGFDQAFSEKIFNTFTRLHPKDRYEGTGLGLSLCKKIVQRHHGHISAKSSPGKGSEFIVQLPIVQAARSL